MKKNFKFSFVDKIRDRLMFYFLKSENIWIYSLYGIYREIFLASVQRKSPHIDRRRKFIFVHNPKAGGTSLRDILSLPKNGVYSHNTPTFLVSKEDWENLFSITVVRNPLDKFISAYFFICNKNYEGYFRRKYPEIYSFTPRQFFETFKNELFITIPQYRYSRHFLSTKPVDFVIRLEHLERDLQLLSKMTGIKLKKGKRAPHLNNRKYDKNIILKDKKLVKDVQDYYHSDYQIFGYDL